MSKLMVAAILAMTVVGCGRRVVYRNVQVAVSCAVSEDALGVQITCPGSDPVRIEHGQDGADGIDAVVEIIDPCGDHEGPDEILLVLAGGEIVAWYKSKGPVVLTDGHYRTTDSQRCEFQIAGGQYYEQNN